MIHQSSSQRLSSGITTDDKAAMSRGGRFSQVDGIWKVTPRRGSRLNSKATPEQSKEFLAKKWSERLKGLPLSGPAVQVEVLQSMSATAVQLELLAEELLSTASAACLDAMELCRLIKEEVFSIAALLSNTTRGMTSYANKHIIAKPTQMYEVLNEIGHGSYGTVHKAIHKQTKQVHAVKFLLRSKVNTNELWAEIDIMKQLDHPHVMRLYNTFEDVDYIYISSEYCVGGPFFDTISKAGNLAEPNTCRLFRQIIGVVTYLHSRSICHRDVKPENFLVLKNTEIEKLHLKLIDFGSAKRFDLLEMVTKVCTPHYVAPEVLSAKPTPYTEKVDVWSCGVILFTMLGGRLPFHKDNNIELLKLVKKGKFEFEPQQVWQFVSEPAHDLVKKVLCVSVEDRATADQAFHHQWCCQQSEQGGHAISPQMIAQIHRFLTNNRLKRVALRIIARQIDDDAIAQQRSVWLSVDNDNSGSLTLDEMHQAVNRLDVNSMIRDGMVEIIAQLDPTGSGVVEWTEFLAASLEKKQYLQEDVCLAAFTRLDFDGDGFLSRKDLGRLLSDQDGMRDAGLTGATLAELVDELEDIMMSADVNNDGGVSFEEFMKVMDDECLLPSVTAARRRSLRESHYTEGMKKLWSMELSHMEQEHADPSTEFLSPFGGSFGEQTEPYEGTESYSNNPKEP